MDADDINIRIRELQNLVADEDRKRLQFRVSNLLIKKKYLFFNVFE